MTDPDEQVEELEMLVDTGRMLVAASRAYVDRYPGDAIAANADRQLAFAFGAWSRAIEKLASKAAREEAKEARHTAHATERQFDDLTKQLAKQRGISYEAMQQIRDEAAQRSREAANRGSLADQLAAAPSLNPEDPR